MIHYQLYSGWRDLTVFDFQLAQAQQLAKIMSNFTITTPILSSDEEGERVNT